jgi:hypothetical protein
MLQYSSRCRLAAGLLTLSMGLPAARAEDPLRLLEVFPSGYQYHVSTRVELSGSLTLPAEKGKATPKPLSVSGDSAIEYDERVLTVDKNGLVQKTARVYRKMEFQRKIGEQPQETSLRPEARKMVVLRHKNQEVPFSPDGPLTWGEIDLVRTDVFAPALTGLLPDKAVQVDDRWKASALAIQELTDLEKIDDGEVECRLEQVTTIEKRRHARVAFSGTVRGPNEDGPSKQQLTGYFYFDLESNHLSYLHLKGVHSLLDADGKEIGRVEGRFTMTRQVNQKAKELSDEALRSWTLEPTEENSALLYDNTDLGLRFLYPRRWKVAGGQGRQVALDGSEGSGVLLTLEPAGNVPTAKQFLKESRDFLQNQKAKILSFEDPRRLQDAPRELDHFVIDVEMGKERVLMAYFVARQGKGGVTVAARVAGKDSVALRREVEGIARSIVVTKTIEAEKPPIDPNMKK